MVPANSGTRRHVGLETWCNSWDTTSRSASLAQNLSFLSIFKTAQNPPPDVWLKWNGLVYPLCRCFHTLSRVSLLCVWLRYALCVCHTSGRVTWRRGVFLRTLSRFMRKRDLSVLNFLRPLPTPAFELDRPNAVWLHVRGGSYFNKVRHDPYPRAEGSSPAPPPPILWDLLHAPTRYVYNPQ